MDELIQKDKADRQWAWRVFILLHLYVIFSMVAQFFNGNYIDVFLCLLTLLLFQIPSFVDRKFQIQFPDTLQIVISIFGYAYLISRDDRSFAKKFIPVVRLRR